MRALIVNIWYSSHCMDMRNSIVVIIERCTQFIKMVVLFSTGLHKFRSNLYLFNVYTGEALSFYLSRLLRMDSVPAVILAQTNVTSSVWRAVNISSLSWKEDKTVALIQWIDDLNSGAR